jgi:hypothetical protein
MRLKDHPSILTNDGGHHHDIGHSFLEFNTRQTMMEVISMFTKFAFLFETHSRMKSVSSPQTTRMSSQAKEMLKSLLQTDHQ